ncbi:MAG: acetyl-CoA carboxylase biotin carboxyl carrier protein [Phycisphaerales bacterium]|nr:MAG: acetyl-CoA carboxylase biotin carboxyl carrier protein [Phycisphaerales bacterium]
MVDIEHIRQLIEMMVENDLVELSVKHGEEELKLRRPNVAEAAAGASPAPAATALPATAPAAEGGEAAAAEDEAKLAKITSPMVGTFYAAPSPDTPPFVKVGSDIRRDTVVCIVEAMKVFNEIKAEISGTIVEIHVENGAAVEFGQPLFTVRRS